MFGFEMEIDNFLLEIYENGQTLPSQRQQQMAPPQIMQMQYLQLLQQAIHAPGAIRIKLTRYNQSGELVATTEFYNNIWIDRVGQPE